jgi:hypothetical protein
MAGLSVARPIACRPLSTYTIDPVIEAANGEAKNAATFPMSSTAPNQRPLVNPERNAFPSPPYPLSNLVFHVHRFRVSGEMYTCTYMKVTLHVYNEQRRHDLI